jgi:hypothetical protein
MAMHSTFTFVAVSVEFGVDFHVWILHHTLDQLKQSFILILTSNALC